VDIGWFLGPEVRGSIGRQLKEYQGCLLTMIKTAGYVSLNVGKAVLIMPVFSMKKIPEKKVFSLKLILPIVA